jgi:hypothetical protein
LCWHHSQGNFYTFEFEPQIFNQMFYFFFLESNVLLPLSSGSAETSEGRAYPHSPGHKRRVRLIHPPLLFPSVRADRQGHRGVRGRYPGEVADPHEE